MKPASTATLARKLGLSIAKPASLTIRRRRDGESWTYWSGRGRRISDKRVVLRLNKLAVPPAYEDVRFAADPRAHIQAIGRDAAGRLQYRYHRDWEKIRDIRKTQQLIDLIEVLPRIRRALAAKLGEETLSREFALAAIVELIAASAIRAGGEEYARDHKTRGAATLLKSNVRCGDDGAIQLCFRAKGGKLVRKEVKHTRLCAAIERLRELPGARMFQFRGGDGTIRAASAADANVFLKEIAGCPISLKDFRTLCGTAEVIETLAAIEPAKNARLRGKQIVEAIKAAAQTLENTPAVCRRSYVHAAVLTAFESGMLKEFASVLKAARSSAPAQNAVGAVLEANSAAA